MNRETALRRQDDPTALAANPLAVGRLSITAFRSYAGATLTLTPRPVVLTGANGAGKTNLLEAVSMLVPGRGLRRARLSEIDHRPAPNQPGPHPWAVAATVLGPDGPVAIGTGRDVDSPGERRLVRIDGVPARSQATLAGHLAAVWLTPQQDGLFVDAAAARRRFLDRLVYALDADHAGRLSRYEKALRERSRLLRAPGRIERTWITALEERLAEEGVAVAAARRHLVERLDRACRAGSTIFPAATLGLSGDTEALLETAPALAVEERLRERLAAERGRDAEAGGARTGIHRSDLLVGHGAKRLPAALCSTGEQKALLIAVVLAHARLIAAETGAAPILLLDEVAAHLDAERRAALFAEIVALRSQAWLTGTDCGLFAPLARDAQFITVTPGALTPIYDEDVADAATECSPA